MQKALSFLLAFLFLIFTENALGGGDFFCSGCAGVTSSSSWVTIYSQGTGVHLFGQYVKASGLNKTGFYLKDLQDTRETIQQMTSLVTLPSFIRELTLAAAIPYVRKSTITLVKDWPFTQFHAAGLGDVQLYGKYTLGPGRLLGNEFLEAIFGIELPTGRTDLTDKGGVLLAPTLQPGSGSFDYLLRLAIRHALGRRMLMTSEVTYRIATEGGAQAYRYGNLLSLRLGSSFNLTQRLTSLLNLRGEWEGGAFQNGIPLDDTGGTTLFLSMGLRSRWSRRGALDLLFQYPLFQRKNGVQVKLDYGISISGSFYF